MVKQFGCPIRVAICLSVLGSVLVPAAARAKVIKAPLATQGYEVGTLYPSSEQTVAVSVVDAREDRALVGGGILGPKGDEGKGIMVIYVSERDEEAQKLLESAVKQAVGVQGMKPGPGGLALELTLSDLWIEMYRYSGFSPMNCLGYVGLSVALTGAGGESLGTRSYRLVFFENTTPVGSMKEVSREAVSRVLVQAAWQATARALGEQFGLVADPARLATLTAKIDGLKDEAMARQAIFWLGLAGKGDANVTAKLRGLLGSDAQRVHEAAAEALGLAGASEARADLEAILGGAKRGGWDVTDLEHVWYLAHGLLLMGADDVAAKLPRKDLEPVEKLDDLLHFHATGERPPLTAAEQEKLAKELPKVAKKRKG